MDASNFDIEREIIAQALAASTYDEAVAVAKQIESHIGARHQRPVGDRYNNYGLMASSGSYEYKALEPVTNEQDAVLERLAVKRWGDLKQVPYQRPDEAAQDLMKDLNYQQQADMVTVTLLESDPPTRSSKKLTIVYRDKGCGLEAGAIPKTIFALGSSHKTESNWHQGAFGIGGASTYRNARAVVLVTRAAPEMKPKEDRIAVAVVLWEAQGKGQSAYYLVTTDWPSDPDAEPWSAPASAFPEFEPGAHLALISYGVEGFHRARSGDERSFDTVLNTRLFDPIIPVRFTNEITRGKNEYLRGLSRRLADNPSADRLCDDDKLLYTYGGNSYQLPVTYYVFPRGKDAEGKEVSGARRRFVAKDHALVFTSNGQVHHHWTPEQFKLRTKLEKLYERILVVIETDSLPVELRTALFTPDRSQLLANEAALQLEDQVADFLDNWNQLVDINSQLVRHAISTASGGGSVLQVGRKIADALKVRGFGLSGLGGSGGGSGSGKGGPRQRKKVETYADPTTLEGPDKIIVEDGKVRYLQYMINAVDDFLDSKRGELTFETDHPDIDVSKHVVVGRLRDGYVRVQLQVPEGAAQGEYKLGVELNWQKSAGGIGVPMRYTTIVEVVDEIGKGGAGGKAGKKGAGEGSNVAVIWSTPEKYGEGLNNGVPGTVDDIAASDLAAESTEYAELAKLGDQRIPTIVLNETYAPYKAYISARAKNLTEGGTQDASDRYAVGTGLGLLLLHEELKKKEKAGEGVNAAITEEQLAVAKKAVARSVLSIMPAFDTLAKETGVEG
ncbi:hypothetical protein BHQ21_25465 [Mycobacterium sherrisii]|uniref:Uncharacterized protein n=1 Tax=Mycobacterium sherrisii TaxID=243061 RepID=A0A1E3SAI4_9MYCO|nr:hypothetical protein [Mycobacterium sherrisii]ODQ99158.1 hypothetical protein BHQ21_25465 [Mycobacterium sherrisii]